MMIGETQRHQSHVPPWQLPDPITALPSPNDDVLASLRRYLLSSGSGDQDADFSGEFPAEDDDDFFMYEFKVRKCTRARAHDWTECPFVHPGEKARRRDPRKYSYSGTACSDFRKGGCKKGDGCEFAHGVFECWLHPSRYRTQACKDEPGCKRRVCFFAHSPDQLRAASGLVGSPRSENSDGSGSGFGSVGELVASLRNLQLSKVKSMPTSSWGVGSPVFGSPRGGSVSRAGFLSLPTTPTRPGIGYLDWGDKKGEGEESVVMERVESGRELRARMFEKLSKENPLNGSVPVEGSGTGMGQGPDFGWVSDLIT